MNEELKQRLADFFESAELVEYLGITVEEIIDAFEDKALEALDEIEELMQVKHG